MKLNHKRSLWFEQTNKEIDKMQENLRYEKNEFVEVIIFCVRGFISCISRLTMMLLNFFLNLGPRLFLYRSQVTLLPLL